MNGIDITKFLETLYPQSLAYDWDNVGLQVGSLNRKVRSVLITLDVTKEVVKEASDMKVDLIISHHPLIFKPISSVSIESPRGWIINHLIKHDIALYSMHTNYDLAEGGMNDELALVLGIRSPQVLDEIERIGRFGEVDEMDMSSFVAKVKTALQIDSVRLIGSLDKRIRIVGISGGSGSNHVGQAKKQNCDVYLTGDVTYHTALDCIQMGLNVLDVGHYAEKIFKVAIARQIQKKYPELTVIISGIDSNPYQSV
jgi:GTP cyclohydrolase I